MTFTLPLSRPAARRLRRSSAASAMLATALALAGCASSQNPAPLAVTIAPVTPVVRTPPAVAPSQSFNDWRQGFKARAVAAGIAPATLSAALDGITPNQTVIDLDRKQPEGTTTFASYMERIVSPDRIAKGRKMLAENRPVLDRVAAAYGVPAKVVVSLWGIETSFGGYTGNFSIVRSLATLAYEGRRASLFENELIAALKIMQAQGYTRDKLIGSWAGAMGQCQFMPSSYLKYAVDFDGDGHPDIWSSKPDVFASAANYLHQNGWVNGQAWGRQVRLPAGFNPANASADKVRTVKEWQSAGLVNLDGSALAPSDLRASVALPGGASGPAYLVYENYRTILRWNRSNYFAMAVLTLADAIGN